MREDRSTTQAQRQAQRRVARRRLLSDRKREKSLENQGGSRCVSPIVYAWRSALCIMARRVVLRECLGNFSRIGATQAQRTTLVVFLKRPPRPILNLAMRGNKSAM